MMARHPLRVAVIGCGRMGTIRAQVAADHPGTVLASLCDSDPDIAGQLAARHDVPAFRDPSRALASEPDITVIATPGDGCLPIALEAFESGSHVLVEKPPGRTLGETEAMARAASAAGKRLKVGFNHRFHPAVRESLRLAQDGRLGSLIFARSIYGHGGRPGYGAEWRCDPCRSGGGELLDQGIHVLDLLHAVFGAPAYVRAELGGGFWNSDVEDNAFALLRYPGGQTASIHASWTQWKNRFHWQVYGELGAVEVEGLGGSYGIETLTVLMRRPDGGAPDQRSQAFPGPDVSWREEWTDFVEALREGRAPTGDADEALDVMRTVDALYRSAAADRTLGAGTVG